MNAKDIDIAQKIRIAVAKDNLQYKDIYTSLEISNSNWVNQIKRNNFRLSDIVKIFDIIGYDVDIKIVDRESKEEL